MAGDPPKDSPEGDGKKDAGAKVKKEEPPPEPPLSPEASLRRASSLLEKAVSSREARLAARALRLTAALKRENKLQPSLLASFVRESLPEASASRALLLQNLAAVREGGEGERGLAETASGTLQQNFLLLDRSDCLCPL